MIVNDARDIVASEAVISGGPTGGTSTLAGRTDEAVRVFPLSSRTVYRALIQVHLLVVGLRSSGNGFNVNSTLRTSR